MNHKAYIIHLSSGYNNKYKKGSLVYVLESQSGEKTIISKIIVILILSHIT